MSLLGKSPPRPDGLDKVTGRAIFADDERVQSLWYGATVRSSHARAQIEAISFDTTAAPTGSVCVTAADLPGPNCVRLIEDDWPILAKSQTHHHGEPVALVAAPSRLAALQAREAVNVEYRPLPGVFDLEAAAVEYPLLSELELVCGEPEQALRQAEIVVEGTYSSGHQEHIYIECQAMTAGFDVNGRLEVSGTMQCPYYVHGSLCHALGMPADQVRVRATAVGGGFGGKEDYPSMLAIHAALLARECGHPVRIVYDRHEDIVGTTKRHPAVVRHRTAVDSDGLIQAMDIDVVLDGGAYTTLSPVVLSLRQRARAWQGREDQHGHQRRVSGLRSSAVAVRHRATDGSNWAQSRARSLRNPPAQRPARRRSIADWPGARRVDIGPGLPREGGRESRLSTPLARGREFPQR
jgi:CO/xanthine dehydrogenase Mo-binding subunit